MPHSAVLTRPWPCPDDEAIGVDGGKALVALASVGNFAAGKFEFGKLGADGVFGVGNEENGSPGAGGTLLLADGPNGNWFDPATGCV